MAAIFPLLAGLCQHYLAFTLNIILTPKQEEFIQAKLQTDKYRNAEEVLELAFRLLDEYEQADAEWINSVGEKIDAAIAISNQIPPVDGKTFVNQIPEQHLICILNRSRRTRALSRREKRFVLFVKP